MMGRIAGLLVFAAASAAVAHGQYSQEYNTCMGRAHSNIVQVGMCAQTELSKQDGRLNKAYSQLMSQYKPNDPKRIALRDDERSWLKKRDYDCKIDHETIDNGCLLDKTAKRADDLEHQLKF